MGEKIEKAKGHVKEAVGDATDNEDLEREGKLDRASGSFQEKTREVAEKAKEKVNDIFE